MINHKDYEGLCDYSYDGDERSVEGLENSIVYVPTDHIAEFFQLCRAKCIVVSANSDYGVVNQAEYPVSHDTHVWFNFLKEEDIGYGDIHVPGRCIKEHCKITDQFSVKVYSFTKATFPEIPSNIVKWFTTNCQIDDPRVEHLPFGVPDWTKDLLEKTENKQNKIYVNFQLNTVERLYLARYCVGNEFFTSKEVDKPTYVKDLQTCKYVLCPPGNGLDTFRTMEVLSCGSIPVLPRNKCLEKTYREHAVYYDSVNDLNIESLDKQTWVPPIDRYTIEYWKNYIEQSRNLL